MEKFAKCLKLFENEQKKLVPIRLLKVIIKKLFDILLLNLNKKK